MIVKACMGLNFVDQGPADGRCYHCCRVWPVGGLGAPVLGEGGDLSPPHSLCCVCGGFPTRPPCGRGAVYGDGWGLGGRCFPGLSHSFPWHPTVLVLWSLGGRGVSARLGAVVTASAAATGPRVLFYIHRTKPLLIHEKSQSSKISYYSPFKSRYCLTKTEWSQKWYQSSDNFKLYDRPFFFFLYHERSIKRSEHVDNFCIGLDKMN